MNGTNGSFYLQSKVYRAKEAMEEEYKSEGKWTPEQGEAPSAAEGEKKAVASGDAHEK